MQDSSSARQPFCDRAKNFFITFFCLLFHDFSLPEVFPKSQNNRRSHEELRSQFSQRPELHLKGNFYRSSSDLLLLIRFSSPLRDLIPHKYFILSQSAFGAGRYFTEASSEKLTLWKEENEKVKRFSLGKSSGSSNVLLAPIAMLPLFSWRHSGGKFNYESSWWQGGIWCYTSSSLYIIDDRSYTMSPSWCYFNLSFFWLDSFPVERKYLFTSVLN